MIKPGQIRDRVNDLLAPLNLQVATLTAERQEQSRLLKLENSGHFVEPAFPLLESFANCDSSEILAAVKQFKRETDQFLEDRETDIPTPTTILLLPTRKSHTQLCATLSPAI